MTILIIIYAVSALLYLYYNFIFLKGLDKEQDISLTSKPFVSVVVAARNEEKRLPYLLTSLINQSYPAAMFEVIVANDSSDDDTAGVVRKFAEKWNNIKLVNVTGRENVRSPKKNALGQAIAAAKGEIILSTDADCITGIHWISSMVASYDDDTAMVAGYSSTDPGKWKKISFIRKFEHVDSHIIFAAAAGALNNAKYFSCSGQNISYRKSAFEAVGGFESIKHILSGDDINLMQLIRRTGKKIRFCMNYHSFVKTRPIDSLGAFLNQRARWASNTSWQIILNPEFFVYLLGTFITNIGLIPMFFVNTWIASAVFTAKLISDFVFFRVSFMKFNIDKEKMVFFPIWFICYPFYVFASAISGMAGLFSWHGRK